MFGLETLRNILKPLKNYTNGFKVLRGFDRFENITKLEVSKGYFQGLILSFFRFVQDSETLKYLKTFTKVTVVSIGLTPRISRTTVVEIIMTYVGTISNLGCSLSLSKDI